MLSLSHLLFFGPIAFSLVRIFFCDSFELACFLSSLLFFCTPLPPLCFHHCTLQSLELSELLSQFFFWFFLFLGEINILLNLFLSLRESVSFVFIYLFLCPDTFSRSRSLKLALPVYSVSLFFLSSFVQTCIVHAGFDSADLLLALHASTTSRFFLFLSFSARNFHR